MMNKDVIVVIGAGAIAVACARRVSVGKRVLLADVRLENVEAAAQSLREAGFECQTVQTDVADRTSVQALADLAGALGEVVGVIHSAGVSPSQATPQTVCRVDLYGTALVLELFGNIIARGGSAVVIGSQSSHRLPPLSVEENCALATTPTDALLDLSLVKTIDDSLYAYQIAKRGNALRVQAEAVRWAKRGARVNCISPGIIYTPLALAELNSKTRGAMYRTMLANSPVGRGGSPDEVAAVAELLMGKDGGFITGSDFLMDGGVSAAYWHGGAGLQHN